MNFHTEGRWKGLPDYEPQLQGRPPNSRCNLVAQVVMRDDQGDGGHWCQGILTKQRFRLQGHIPVEAGCPKVTIMNGLVSFYRWPLLKIDSKADLLIHQPREQGDIFSLMETCAGMGALGLGASLTGWKVSAQNDISPKFAEHQRKVAPCPVIEGNIGIMKTVCELHRADPTSASMGFGFACQPFSALGDKREGSEMKGHPAYH